MNGDTIAMLERIGFRKVYDLEYRVHRKWFSDEQAQEWKRCAPHYWSTHLRTKDLRDEAISLQHKSSRGKAVYLSEEDAKRVAYLKLELFRRQYEAGLVTADSKPTDFRIKCRWEYFGDIEKQTEEAVWELEVSDVREWKGA